jgi:hypothetical protein
MESYSQSGQDLFVYNLMNGKTGTFLDLGCSLPKKINNTYLLELNGWDGISLDIQDFNEQWKVRNCKFLQKDCLNQDYNDLLKDYYSDKVIDYLTLDMEGCGDRFKLLQKIIDTNYTFKIITIEHDAYIGNHFHEQERVPQRELLKSKGYRLLCADVSHELYKNHPFEDWWVNEEYFEKSELDKWSSDNISCDEIFNKLNIEYKVAHESKDR